MTIPARRENAGNSAARDGGKVLRVDAPGETGSFPPDVPEVRPSPTPVFAIDVIKALASQLIVWHHFISYGPMARTVYPHAANLFDWLYNDGRLAVQAFLVVGGFLAARSLAPQPHQLSFDASGAALARLAWRRYVRLVRPYLVALALAIVLSAFARVLMSDPDTPQAPSFRQVLFHVLLIHDIAGVDALTTGVWYVAMDLQLYCMLLLLLWAAQRLASVLRMEAQTLGLSLMVGLAASSLLWFNRDDTFESWGVFFFGTYALGAMMQWASAERSKQPWMIVMLLILVLALALEWRKPLIAAMLIAAFLGLGLHSNYRMKRGLARFVGWLSCISYSVFLIHYPIILIVGTIVARLWPENFFMAVIGFVTAWLMTLWVANAIHDRVEIAWFRGRAFGSLV